MLYILPLWHKCHGRYFISPCIPDNWSRLQILQFYYLLWPFKNMSQLTWCLSLTYSSVGERLIFLPFLCSPCLLVAIYETGHGIPVWSHNIELLLSDWGRSMHTARYLCLSVHKPVALSCSMMLLLMRCVSIFHPVPGDKQLLWFILPITLVEPMSCSFDWFRFLYTPSI